MAGLSPPFPARLRSGSSLPSGRCVRTVSSAACEFPPGRTGDQRVPVQLAFVPDRPNFRWPQVAVNNFIDQHVFARLRASGRTFEQDGALWFRSTAMGDDKDDKKDDDKDDPKPKAADPAPVASAAPAARLKSAHTTLKDDPVASDPEALATCVSRIRIESQVVVGSEETYEPLCRNCYNKAMKEMKG